jgi:MoaA/NifB/PqqE/SkfB family radical SAM enzyme
MEQVRARYSKESTAIQVVSVDIVDEETYSTDIVPLLNPPATICQYPWTSLQFGPTGRMRPCCILKNPIQHLGKDINIADKPTFKEIYYSDSMVKLRAEFRTGGRPSECDKCWAEEAAGKASDRLTYNSHRPRFSVDYEAENIDNLVSFDTELGNLCNLACRMCNPYSSSTWAAEILEDVARDNIVVHPAYIMKQQGTWPKNNDQYWAEFARYLPQIRYLQFAGGEPMMTPYHFKLLRTAVESGDSKHIQLRYNSNGTVFNEEAIELWPKFERVKLAFSIDNLGDRFEYERYRGVWPEAVEVMREFNQYRSANFETEVSCTVNIQNVYYLPEIYVIVPNRLIPYT